MTTNSSDYSEAVREYVEAELEDSFEFEERLSPDEDDPLYDDGRIIVGESE